MTIRIKEIDGRRDMEIEEKDGVLYIDGGSGRFCLAFDIAIFMHALERECSVRIAKGALVTAMEPFESALGTRVSIRKPTVDLLAN